MVHGLMKKPEPKIDGANVLYWAWSGDQPFGWVGDPKDPEASPIYGLAIAQYDHQPPFYRFSCDADWETVQDQDYDTLGDAIKLLPEQYREVIAIWHEYKP